MTLHSGRAAYTAALRAHRDNASSQLTADGERERHARSLRAGRTERGALREEAWKRDGVRGSVRTFALTKGRALASRCNNVSAEGTASALQANFATDAPFAVTGIGLLARSVIAVSAKGTAERDREQSKSAPGRKRFRWARWESVG